MATLSSTIELQDNFSNVLNTIIGGIYRGVSAVETFQSTMNESAPTSFVDSVAAQANQATAALQQMQDAAANGTNIEVEVATSEAQQRIADIQQQLEGILPIQNAINEVARNTYFMPEDTVDKLTAVNKNIQNMQGALTYLNNNKIDLDSEYAQMQIKALTEGIEAATQQQTELNAALGDIPSQVAATVNVEISVPEWQSDSLEVFTTTGVERFEQEVQSANNMLNTLNQTQSKIAAQAANTNIFPSNMVTDMNGLQSRLQAIQNRMQQIESNPLNMGTDEANAELEQLRAQLDQAVQQQQAMNDAVDNMDVEAANAAYLQLSQTVSNTERYIRDNTTEQGQFNSTIEQGVESANSLQTMIKGALAAYTGIAGIRKAVSWIQECTEAFNTQLNAENQLMVVLGNMLDADYVSQFEIEVTADTSDAVDEINAISSTIDDEVVVTVSAETKALEAEFDAITAKAAEIQSEGIYGDEAMIAAAAEFATYFSDVDAITTMMDTLADYAMGMSGGGEIDTESMVEYATNLGKIMSGSYDAMTKKGFEFTEAQEAIIEGTATQEQIIATLGEEYLDMSEDMQAAAAISQVIEESWAGLYESMSDTPEGKIIQMNNAFGDLKETIGGELYPYVILFVDAINENWSTITAVIQGIATALEFLMGVLSVVLEAALNVGSFIAENWSIISPIVYGVAAALAVYYGYLLLTKTAELASAAVKGVVAVAEGIHAAAIWATTSATWAEVTAQQGLNAAMYACPVVWIVIAILAIIAVIYAAVAAINKFAGTSISATGVICGVFATAGAFIGNIVIAAINIIIGVFVTLWNFIAAFANFFANVFTDPVGAIARLFFDLVDTILSLLQTLAQAIDTIFGSNLAGSVQGWRDSLGSWVDETFGEGEEIMSTISLEDYAIDRIDYSDAWDAGYSFGEGIEDTVSNLSLSDLFNTDDVVSAEDYLTDYDATSSLGSDVSDIADSASTVADSVDCTEEELKYLRDIAEQETVNRFTLAEVNIDQSGMQNNISNGMDLDGVVNGLTDAVNEAIDIVTEGVHD
ncbi:MAG: phage tail tape measure protein [Oscillospiraceae bacterium]|nr:phage tail tape measure protein [Oscillospiraceae bacterium]